MRRSSDEEARVGRIRTSTMAQHLRTPIPRAPPPALCRSGRCNDVPSLPDAHCRCASWRRASSACGSGSYRRRRSKSAVDHRLTLRVVLTDADTLMEQPDAACDERPAMHQHLHRALRDVVPTLRRPRTARWATVRVRAVRVRAVRVRAVPFDARPHRCCVSFLSADQSESLEVSISKLTAGPYIDT